MSMLGGSPIGSAPICFAATSRAVYMSASIDCSVASVAGIKRKRGVRAAALSSLAHTARLVHGLRASRQGKATPNATISVRRGMSAMAFGYSSATLLARLRVDLSAFALCTATARLTPYTGIMQADTLACSATATATLARGRQMFATASSGATASDAPMFCIRGLSSVAGLSADVSFVGEPDIWDGGLAGVRMAHISSIKPATCTPTATMRPTRNMKATRQASCVATGRIRRKRKMLTPVRISKALVLRAALRASRVMAPIALAATLFASVAMNPKRMLRISERVSRAIVGAAALFRKPAKMSASLESGAAFGPVAVKRLRTMQAAASGSAVSSGLLRRLVRLRASVLLGSSSVSADLTSNPFDDEPDYRTVFVSAQSMTLSVQAQAFTINIGSDSKAMQTFTKQPGERLAYDIDLTDWFAELEGDDIEAASATVTSASSGLVTDITIDPPYRIGTPCYRVKIWTEGGLNGATYQVRCTLDTEGGRRKEVDFKIKVKEY